MLLREYAASGDSFIRVEESTINWGDECQK